tara:strand:+ start:1106 stop:1759 length:654 start_codon:yes stop_codon:yes gene_type:complete
MDGNQRWAKKNKLSEKEGYLKGLNNIKEIIRISIKLKVKYLTLFALSSENIRRKSIFTIFDILLNNSKKLIEEFKHNKEAKIKIIGEKDNLSKDVLNTLTELEKTTYKNNKIFLNIAFNYGSNNELVSVFNRILEDYKKTSQPINYKLIKKHMYLPDIPEPDLLIRTGGFKRLSNFLLLYLSYTELYFSETLWPDFSEDELINIINKYQKIERKYGL